MSNENSEDGSNERHGGGSPGRRVTGGRDDDDLVATVSRAAMRDAIDVGVEAATGCLWVVIGLDVGALELEASVRPAASEVLYRDLRGGVTPEGIERARLEAATR